VLDLSIIIPTYDEEDNVEPLYQALMATVPGLGRRFEIIFVDDGSRDQTFERLAALAARDSRVRVIKLRRNCGQAPAMAAGIDHARGRVLVTMDADLQNDPADIGSLLAKLEEGYDLVVGWRHERQDKWLSRKLPSVIANRLIALITGVDVKDNGCTLKAFRADLIKYVPLYGELHRFIPAMTSTVGCRLAEVKVRHHPRRFGSSKYGLSRIYKVLLDIVTIKTLLTFARRPLFCFFSVAAVALVVSAAFTAFSILFLGQSVVVFMSIAILGGSLALFLGFAGVISSLVSQYGGDRLAPLPPTTGADGP
jgi:glycosyltransferase involved in cell wall biosynthesis